MIYHVGKFKTGLDLQGMEGVVQADVRNFKGMELSATMPWKVQFEAPAPDGSDKPVKVIAHLVSGGIGGGGRPLSCAWRRVLYASSRDDALPFLLFLQDTHEIEAV